LEDDPGRPFDKHDPAYRIMHARSDTLQEDSPLPREWLAETEKMQSARSRGETCHQVCRTAPGDVL
jgi:hypothetical protein